MNIKAAVITFGVVLGAILCAILLICYPLVIAVLCAVCVVSWLIFVMYIVIRMEIER